MKTISNSTAKKLILGFRGTEIPSWLFEFYQRHPFSGIILFDYDVQAKQPGNNILSPAQFKALIKDLKTHFPGVIVMIDQEGGLVRRLRPKLGFKDLPSHQEMPTLSSSERRRILAESFAEMCELGVDLNLAPVVDLNDNPDNPDIGKVKRSFGTDVEQVFDLACEWFEEANRVGLGLALKHFPGMGGAKVNSHLELTDITGLVRPEQVELFYRLARAYPGHRCLISHGVSQEWDPKYPISMSEKCMKVLKAKMPHTKFVTDDLQMQGLLKLMSIDTAIEKADQAGVDEIIIGNNMGTWPKPN